ncbi:hypothetical protein, partial [Burkholderia multivorans]|uniref:hypothetical protein n=1 Tax=Burkholderia multivorans TaxID=87883 RepID=UPI0021596ACF
RLLHAVELLNEKILLLTTSLFREDYRMASCRTLDPFQWMAREAIQKLRDYENRVAEVSSMRDSREASTEDRQHGR